MDDKARIAANVDKMIKAKAPREDIERYLASEGLSKQSAAPPEPTEPSTEPLPLGQRIAGGLSAGLGILPGGNALMAGIGAIGEPTYDESLKTLEESQAAAPWALKRGMQAAGLAGSMALTPLKVLQGARGAGALFGGGLSAAQRAMEAKPESLSDRLKGTAFAGGVGAGLGYVAPWMVGHAIPRTILGAGVGGLAGWDVAPEGKKMTGAAAGTLAGGVVAASPTKSVELASRAVGRVAPRIMALREALGVRGAVNKELGGTQQLLDAIGVGGRVGDGRGGAEVLGATKAAQGVVSGANYPAALAQGEQAWQAHQQGRADVIDENVRRMVEQIRQEAEDAAAALSPTTTQSATARPVQSVREAIEDLRAASAEAARRQGPEGATGPFAGRSPRGSDVIQQDRFGSFQRPVLGQRETHLGTTPGRGEPQFVDRPGIYPEPSLEFPAPVNTAVRRGAAPRGAAGAANVPANETPIQKQAREALERRAAYEALPATVRPAPRPPMEGQLPVPTEVHPAVIPMYQNEQVVKAAEAVRKLAAFRHLPADDPRFIDEVYKVIGDAKAGLGKRIMGSEGPVNFIRASRAELQDAQNEILRATDDLMPIYRSAVDEHAYYESWMRAFRRGYDAVTAGGNTSKGKILKSPDAVERWIRQQQDPSIQEAARLGARYAQNDVISKVPLTQGRAGVLAKRPFTEAPEDVARRALTGRPEVERAVGTAREEAAREATRGIRYWLPGISGHAITQAINATFKPPLEREAAKKIINAVLADPASYQQTLQKYATGTEMLKKMERLLQAQVGLWAGR